MATKIKSKSLQDQLTEREEVALTEYRETLEAVEATRERAVALHEQAEAAELAAEEVQARLARGDETVTAADLLTGRAEHDRAKLLASGRAASLKALERKADVTYNKEVAQIVLDTLLAAEPLAGVTGLQAHATFSTRGWEAESMDIDLSAGPVLIVTQHDGSLEADGLGQAKLTITWHRPALTMPLEGKHVATVLRSAGISVGRGHNAFMERGDETYDALSGRVWHVSPDLPAVQEPLADTQAHFYEWPRSWSAALSAAHQAACAEQVGRARTKVQEADGKRTTTVDLEADLWVDDLAHGSAGCSPDVVQKRARESFLRRVVPGVGRCVGAEAIRPRERLSREHARSAVRLTFEARTA